jgi:uncharacterized RDD family membrane protein YckC
MDFLSEFVENPKFARKHVRVFAACIDLIVLTILAYLVGFLFGQSYARSNTIGFELTGLPLFLFFILGFLFVPISEGLFGQTFGKRLMRIKVVRMDLTETNLGISIIRHLFDFVDCFCLIGFIVASRNKSNQRIGDHVAKTYVVDKL